MSVSDRPSMQSVQRSLLVGLLIGLILGLIIGAGIVGVYIRQNPPVYSGGAYPNELSPNYQDHYLAMVIDSYIVNRQADVAKERLKTFSEAQKIKALGRWSAIYVAGGRAAEAQAVNDLAVALKDAEGWSPETVSQAASELATEFKDDGAKAQAITTFANRLGQVPVAAEQAEQPADAAEAAETPAPAQADEGGVSLWLIALLCLLGLALLALGGIILYRRLGGRPTTPVKPEAVWEGEGPAPLKMWTGTYDVDRSMFDESFTVETEAGAFVGEVGMSISETVSATIPGTSPTQVTAFDVWVFDKTDITTYTTVLLSESAYNDEMIQADMQTGSQIKSVLAAPGTEFFIEGAAIRVEATVKEMNMAKSDDGSDYFEKLAVGLNVFIKEDADLKIVTMDVPDDFKL